MCFSINGFGSPIGNLIISSLQCKSQTDVLHISLLYVSATFVFEPPLVTLLSLSISKYIIVHSLDTQTQASDLDSGCFF